MSDIIIVTFDKSYYTTREEFNTLMINAANKVSKSIYKGFKFDSTTFILIRSKNKYGNIKTAIDNINNSLKEFAQISSNIHSKIFYIPKDLMFESSGQILKIIMQIIKTNREFDNSIRTITNYDIVKIENEIRISNLVDYCIKNEDVEINYQGIYAKDENRFAAAEALVRLRDKDNNIIYPQSFIPMVEEDGRIVELGMIIFKKVCQFMSKLDFEKLGLDYIEINLSPKQILDPNFIETYTNIIKTYNVNPKNINLEITETSRGFSKNIIDNINFLRNLGITFSLDDFGTGNSNLNYIVNMPVDIVKFDKTMVTSYFKDDIASLVVDYSIKMIKGLGHKIVFEGVENKNQIELIDKMSVDYIQGYYYTKPILEEKFLELIKNTNLKK